MNKKGFTLVEILSVIVLIGLLLGIGIPGINKISERMKNKSYNTKVDLVEQAGILYGQDNKTRLQQSRCTFNEDRKDGDETYPCYKIKIQDLISNDYLEADDEKDSKYVYLDPRDNSDISSKCVYVYKKNNRVYSYYNISDNECKNDGDPDATNPSVDPTGVYLKYSGEENLSITIGTSKTIYDEYYHKYNESIKETDEHQNDILANYSPGEEFLYHLQICDNEECEDLEINNDYEVTIDFIENSESSQIIGQYEVVFKLTQNYIENNNITEKPDDLKKNINLIDNDGPIIIKSDKSILDKENIIYTTILIESATGPKVDELYTNIRTEYFLFDNYDGKIEFDLENYIKSNLYYYEWKDRESYTEKIDNIKDENGNTSTYHINIGRILQNSANALIEYTKYDNWYFNLGINKNEKYFYYYDSTNNKHSISAKTTLDLSQINSWQFLYEINTGKIYTVNSDSPNSTGTFYLIIVADDPNHTTAVYKICNTTPGNYDFNSGNYNDWCNSNSGKNLVNEPGFTTLGIEMYNKVKSLIT